MKSNILNKILNVSKGNLLEDNNKRWKNEGKNVDKK